MAEVSIDLDAMTSLVAAIGTARSELPGAANSLRGNLNLVWLSCPALDKLSGVDADLEAAERDLNRRLALARIIERSTPGVSVVTFDDSVLSTASDAEIAKRVDRIVELMGDLEEKDILDKDGNVIDPELVKLLDENSLDPYFAKALASKLGPDKIDDYLKVVNKARSMGPELGDFDEDDFNAKYRTLLAGLGTSIGMASRGTGSLAVPDLAKKWADYIRSSRDDDDGFIRPGAGNRLSLVIAQGQWSDDFLLQQYHAIKYVEEGHGAPYWGGGLDGPVFDPFWDQDDKDGRVVTDPMRGLFTAAQGNPGVIRSLFTGGETTTVKTKDGEVQVNKELYDFLRHRDVLDEGTVKALLGALASGIGSEPVVGQEAWQPLLATDLTNIGKALDLEAEEAAKDDKPWYVDLGHGILDLAGLIPVIGEPADFINGVWYYADGDVINGSLSMGSAIPFLGYAAVGGKWVKRALSAEELLKLNRLARGGRDIRLFDKAGNVLRNVDLTNPLNFAPEKFLSPAELARWSGSRSFMQKVIAGNRFNTYANRAYDYSEIALVTGRKSRFRLDAYTPGEAIVSRKLTQFSQIDPATAQKYMDEFATKYPTGTRIADTAKNRELGIAGDKLDGPMILEVPPQLGGKIDPDLVKYAEAKGIHIRDINGHYYTKPPD